MLYKFKQYFNRVVRSGASASFSGMYLKHMSIWSTIHMTTAGKPHHNSCGDTAVCFSSKYCSVLSRLSDSEVVARLIEYHLFVLTAGNVDHISARGCFSSLDIAWALREDLEKGLCEPSTWYAVPQSPVGERHTKCDKILANKQTQALSPHLDFPHSCLLRT